MRILLFILCISYTFAHSQTVLISNVDEFIGVDIYEDIYYLQNNSLHKKGQNEYLNIQYGKPTTVDISDPLQIILFYKLFNTVILLDNKLNFVSEFTVPFGTEHVANAGKNKIWMYNTLKMVLTIYNFNTQLTEATSPPLTNKIVQLNGNLNKVVAKNTKNQLTTYNFVARPIASELLSNQQKPISLYKNYSFKNHTLFQDQKVILKYPHDIVNFDVVNQTFYFFKDNNISATPFPKK